MLNCFPRWLELAPSALTSTFNPSASYALNVLANLRISSSKLRIGASSLHFRESNIAATVRGLTPVPKRRPPGGLHSKHFFGGSTNDTSSRRQSTAAAVSEYPVKTNTTTQANLKYRTFNAGERQHTIKQYACSRQDYDFAFARAFGVATAFACASARRPSILRTSSSA